MRAWEIAVAAVVLVACLAVGLIAAEWLAPQPTVGVVRFDAEITFQTATPLIDLLERARDDDQIAAVVLEVASPGGLATSSESIFHTLISLRARKPLVVVVDGLAASGGYYMAVAGNRLFAPASSYIGNVGTRSGRPADPSISSDELSSGPYKLEGGSRFDRIRQLQLVADAFVTHVVAQRAQSTVNPLQLTADEVAEARIYLGSEALALGLIDEEGSRADAIDAAAALAGLTSFQTVDLPARYGYQPPAPQPIDVAVAQMVANAPPGAIFMLDTRIPLPANGAVSPAKTQHSNGAAKPLTTFASMLPQAEGIAP
jgi:protease-4